MSAGTLSITFKYQTVGRKEDQRQKGLPRNPTLRLLLMCHCPPLSVRDYEVEIFLARLIIIAKRQERTGSGEAVSSLGNKTEVKFGLSIKSGDTIS